MGINKNTADFLVAAWGCDTATAFIGVKFPEKRDGENFRNFGVGSVAHAIQLAQKHDAEGHDVYFSCATFKDHSSRTGCNADATNQFWIDLDCGPDKAASGKGYASKKEAATAVRAFCNATALPAPNTIVDSGNGLHVYWIVDRPINAGVWVPMGQKLKALTHSHKLLADDSRTGEIASVLRLPGTNNYKNPSNPKTVTLKRHGPPLDANSLLNLLDAAYLAAGSPSLAKKQAAAVTIGNAAADPAQVEAIAKRVAAKQASLWAGDWERVETDFGATGYPSQSEADFAMVGHIVREAVRSGVADEALPDTVMSVFERSSLYREKKHKQVAEIAIPKVIAEALADKAEAVEKAQQVTQTPEGEELAEGVEGDIKAGQVFAKLMCGKLRYMGAADKWLRWDGTRWAWCACGEEMAAAKFVAGKILNHSSKLFASDPERYKKRMTWATSLQNLKRLQAMIELAKSEKGMAIGHMSELDSDPWLLGVRNGVVNLKDGGLLAPDPAMLITRQAAAEYHDDAQCPKWLEFLGQIFNDDQETIDYIQRALGYTLTGTITEEALFICFGYGANGKSVFSNVVSTIMSDYSSAAPASLLTVRRTDDSGPRNDLARLCGARLVSINETQSGDRLDEQIVKTLAGREMISARFLHKEFFDFWPTAKPWLRTNHKPIITGEDDGIWRRLHLVPFARKFAEHERDPWLESKLLEERDGILTWMVRGCLEWQRHKLKQSTSVRRESATYRKESDLLGEFLDEMTKANPEARVEQSHLFDQYRKWHEANGTRPGSKNTFTKKMAERGYGTSKSTNKRFYTGVELPVSALL